MEREEMTPADFVQTFPRKSRIEVGTLAGERSDFLIYATVDPNLRLPTISETNGFANHPLHGNSSEYQQGCISRNLLKVQYRTYPGQSVRHTAG